MKLHYSTSYITGFILACLLALINTLPTDGLVFPQIINSSHAFVFFCANLFLLKLFLGHIGTIKKVVFISLLSIFIGFLIECFQPYIGRDRSTLDFYYDCIGVLFSAILYSRITSEPRKSTLYILILFCCLALIFPAIRMHQWWSVNHTSTLLNFERSWESISLSTDEGVSIEKTHPPAAFQTNKYVGKINFGLSGSYPGFGLNYPRSNWTNFTELRWEVFSLNEHPVTLNLRIHDAQHNQEYNDRFNYKFTVIPGFNLFSLRLTEVENGPALRHINLADIKNMKFFIAKPYEAISLYFDNIKLH